MAVAFSRADDGVTAEGNVGGRVGGRTRYTEGGGAARGGGSLKARLTQLTPGQVMAIDRALAGIGAFGEVRIVKAKGRVRFIETLESRDLMRIGNDGREG